MLTIIIAEAELECVPPALMRHPSVAAKGGKRTVLLDSSFHHRAMQSLPDAYRRGRPDIVHLCLLNALESPRNKEGCLRVFVHTRNDEVIRIDPSWRVPKAYHRFVGLMEQLFAERVIRSGGTVLLSLEKKRLADLVREEAGTAPVQVMHAEGAPYRHLEDAVVVIGGFPHGDFSTPLPYPRYSIYKDELVAWSVLNYVLYGGT